MSEDGDRLATKADLSAGLSSLEGRLDQKIGGVEKCLDQKIDEVAKRLDQKIGGVEKRLDQKIDGVEKRLDQKIDGVEKRLERKIDRVAMELVKTQNRLQAVEENMATKDDIGRVLNAIDSFAKKSEIYDRAAVLHGRALVEVQTTLQDHEARLKAVESSR